MNEVHDVKLAITYVSEFAYVADGHNGLRVIQLTSPETPGNYGFSPRPTPQLVATYKIPKGGHATCVTKAIDRDRAVDESGNQIAVFGRIGARPFNLEEQRRLYLRDGKHWRVSDDPKDGLSRAAVSGRMTSVPTIVARLRLSPVHPGLLQRLPATPFVKAPSAIDAITASGRPAAHTSTRGRIASISDSEKPFS